MNHFGRRGSIVALTVLFSMPAVRPGAAQAAAENPGAAHAAAENIDARWLPWIGCWRPAEQRAPEEGVHVCVVPAASKGVRILTVAGNQIVVDDTIVADDASRTIDETDCTGTRRAQWSSDGQRLFSNADVTCEKETRKVSGMTLLSTNAEWIDVQVVTVGNREDVRVRRFQRSTDLPPDPTLIPADLAARAASSALGSRLTIEHIKEAGTKVSARVLEGLLFETKTAFPIDSRQLIALDDAGVPDTVIDLMVAFTFPKKFEVKRSSGGSSGGFGGFGWGGFDSGYPWYMDPSYAFFSPFGLGPYGYYDGDYYPYYYPGTGVIVPGPGGGGSQSERHGRVVNGGGYTQVLTRTAENNGQARDGTSSRGANAGGSSAGDSSSGSSGVTSGGYSSGAGGGGGGDSGRTAVPR